MKIRKWALSVAAFGAMLILILDGKTAMEGAGSGIELCIKTVIPSLFPFFILTNVIVSTASGTEIAILRPIGRICGLPPGMESILIPAFLGGYPMGAQAVAQAWRSGLIPKKEADRLLGFCNNAGPSFLFGIASSLFPNLWAAWALWLIHILSAVLTASLLRGKWEDQGSLPARDFSLQQALTASIKAMANVCGWVILFRVLICFLGRWFLWYLHPAGQSAFIGALELSNGLLSLLAVEDLSLRFVLCSGMLAFGGLCVMMQTASVISGLSIRYYMIGKCIQTALSLGLSAALVTRDVTVISFLALLLPLVFLKSRKNSSIPQKAGV